MCNSNLKHGLLAFTTAVPTSGPTTKIGRCTMSQLMVKGQDCERNFYMSYRTNAKEDCKTRYGKMLTCITNGMRYCMEGLFPNASINASVNMALGIYKKVNLSEILCGNAGFPKIPVLQGGTGCKQEFYDKMSIEMNTFYDQYRQNRGDPALCNKYHKVQQHLIKMLESNLCSLEVRKTAEQQLRGVASQAFNPFCAKGQSPTSASDTLHMHTFLYGIISMLFIAIYFVWEN